MSSSATVPDPVKESGRHPVNVVHLVMGLILLGLLAVWGVVQADILDTADLRWLLPLPLLLAGAAGLSAIALSGRHRTTPSGPDLASRTDRERVDEDVSIDQLVNDDTEEIR